MKASRFVQEEKLQKKLEKEGKKETELGAFTKEAMAMKQRSQTTVGFAADAFGWFDILHSEGVIMLALVGFKFLNLDYQLNFQLYSETRCFKDNGLFDACGHYTKS